MDRELEDLRARVRRGDEAARQALLRAVVRAGRPVELAWEGLALRLGPGIQALGAAERARVDADLAAIDSPRLVGCVTGPGSRGAATLVAYPEGRWLVARGAGQVTVDVVGAPDGLDLSDARGRWHVEWEAIEREGVVAVGPGRFADVGRALFVELGLRVDVLREERVGPRLPPTVAYEAWTTWTAGVRRLRLLERWDDLVPLERRELTYHAEVTGLPRSGRLRLDERELGGGFLGYSIEARRGGAAAIEAAWVHVVEAAARAEARSDPAGALVPEAWARRADDLALDPRWLATLDLPGDPSLYLRLRLRAGPPVDGVRWAITLGGRLECVGGPRVLVIEPVGPLPADLTVTSLVAQRDGPLDPAALPGVLQAIAATSRPFAQEAEALAPDPPTIELRRRLRAGAWVALVERRRSWVSSWAARAQHEGGEAAAFVWLTGSLPGAPEVTRLTVRLVGAPAQAEPALARLRAHLSAAGWSVDQ